MLLSIGCKKIFALLIENHADIEIMDASNNTLLMILLFLLLKNVEVVCVSFLVKMTN